MTNFDIKVVSDTVCPWCYIGKKKLEKAIALYQQQYQDSNDTFTISWVPYYLNPNLPAKGVLPHHNVAYMAEISPSNAFDKSLILTSSRHRQT